ncbi:glycoside hydrolase family 26 protein [Paraburkholderia caffeinilytica]|uniref:glycoside hydrolase family 26 protein n=1 Tax=Paraburkholderia caffeinilytica TaxID=1761016 RepID=UPI0013BE9CA7|nr:glycosyl hydrolase [Paraburkholderia caffeinilytica]
MKPSMPINFRVLALASALLCFSSHATATALGLHTGHDDSIAQYDQFGGWLGKQVLYRIAFADDASWQTISSPYFLKATAEWLSSDPNRVETISIPLLPKQRGDANLDAIAAGQHDDTFRKLAHNLGSTHNPARIVVRLGWEMNGTWFAWSAVDNPGSYINAFRHVVSVMHREAPQLRFEWNVASSGAPNFDWSNAYPGDDAVDVISMDVYDQYNSGWSDILGRPGGLRAFRSFAQAHHKPEAYTEWSVSTSKHGHGDAPTFIENMHAWFNVPGANVLYQAYWNTNAGGPDAAISGPSAVNVPRSSLKYRTLFSSGH